MERANEASERRRDRAIRLSIDIPLAPDLAGRYARSSDVLQRPPRWRVRAVVVGATHLDAMSTGSATGTDLTIASERVCGLLPQGDSPFGKFYLVATPHHLDLATKQFETDRTLGHALICLVHRPHAKRSWQPGFWTPASSDQRFCRDWPWDNQNSQG